MIYSYMDYKLYTVVKWTKLNPPQKTLNSTSKTSFTFSSSPILPLAKKSPPSNSINSASFSAPANHSHLSPKKKTWTLLLQTVPSPTTTFKIMPSWSKRSRKLDYSHVNMKCSRKWNPAWMRWKGRKRWWSWRWSPWRSSWVSRRKAQTKCWKH